MSKDEGIYIRCTHTKGDDMLVYQSTNKDVGFIVTSTELDENVAIMTDHIGVRKLRDYLNEILGEEQDTQPAAGEPVAYAAFADNGNIQMWCKAGIDVARIFASTGKSAVPLYAAPPAAAHGDEAVRKDAERYRWLLENRDGMHWENMLRCCDLEGQEAISEFIDAAMRAQGDGGAA